MQLLGTATRFPQQPKGIRNGKHHWSTGSIQAMLQIIQEGLPSQSNDPTIVDSSTFCSVY